MNDGGDGSGTDYDVSSEKHKIFGYFFYFFFLKHVSCVYYTFIESIGVRRNEKKWSYHAYRLRAAARNTAATFCSAQRQHRFTRRDYICDDIPCSTIYIGIRLFCFLCAVISFQFFFFFLSIVRFSSTRLTNQKIKSFIVLNFYFCDAIEISVISVY